MPIFETYLVTFTIVLACIFLLLFIRDKSANNGTSRFFSDILKENENGIAKWSQGRFYLFVSLIFYFFTITLLSLKAVRPNTEIKNETFELVVSALQWVIALFAGYVFGAKGLKVLDSVIKYRLGTKKDASYTDTEETQTNSGQSFVSNNTNAPAGKNDPQV